MATPKPTVSLTDENLFQARTAVLDAISEETGYFLRQIDEVRGKITPGMVAADVQCSRRELDRLLSTLDALGWPPPNTTQRVA